MSNSMNTTNLKGLWTINNAEVFYVEIINFIFTVIIAHSSLVSNSSFLYLTSHLAWKATPPYIPDLRGFDSNR